MLARIHAQITKGPVMGYCHYLMSALCSIVAIESAVSIVHDYLLVEELFISIVSEYGTPLKIERFRP